MGGFKDFSCFRFTAAADDVEENKTAKKLKTAEPAAAAVGAAATTTAASKTLPPDVYLPATETTTYSSWIRRPKVLREGVGLHRRSRSASS